MKNIIYLILLLGVGLASCKKESEKPNIYYGSASATKDNIKWTAKPYGVYDTVRYKKESIGIFARRFEKDIWKETLAFSEVPLVKGIYKLKRASWQVAQKNVGTQFSIEEENGHVSGTLFLLDTLAKTNYFEVLDYNAKKNTVKIKFSATYFIRDRTKSNIIDTIKFKNGIIETKPYN